MVERRYAVLGAVGLILSLVYLYGVYAYQTLSEASPLHALVPWGLMVTGYVFFAFSSGGVFDSMAIRIVFLGEREEVRVAKRLMWLALALLVPGILTVFADLLHIEHSLWIYLGFNPTARIAWNGVLYVIYALTLLTTLVYTIMRGEDVLTTTTGKALLVIGLIASMTLEYNLSMAFGVNTAVPGWFAAPMGIFGIALAFLLGAAWTIVGVRIEGDREAEAAASRELTLTAAAVGFLATWLLVQCLSWGLSAPAAKMLATGSLASLFWAAVLLAIILPLLTGYPLARNSGTARLAVAALAIIGGFMLLHSVFAAGEVARLKVLEPYSALGRHAIGASYIDEALHEVLASRPELLAVIGEFGVWLLLDSLGLALLALRPGEKPTRLYIFR